MHAVIQCGASLAPLVGTRLYAASRRVVRPAAWCSRGHPEASSLPFGETTRHRARHHRAIDATLASLLALLSPAVANADTGDDPAHLPAEARAPAADPARWTFAVDAVVFRRATSGSPVLVSRLPGATTTFGATQSLAGTEALNSRQLDSGYAAGPRIAAFYRLDTDHGIGLTYFALPRLASTQTIGPDHPGDWYVMRAPGFWQTQDFHYQGMSWTAQTELRSLEADIRGTATGAFAWLAGVRWLRLQDRLQGSLTPGDRNVPAWKTGGCAGDPSSAAILASIVGTTLPDTALACASGASVEGYPPFWTTTAVNDLLGVQGGADVTLGAPDALSVRAFGRAGLYGNRARQQAAVSMQKQMYDATAQRTRPAYAAQGGVAVRYAVDKHLSATIGYELLWIDRVALAAAQIGQTVSVANPGSVIAIGVDMSSSILLQGFTVGIEYAF